MPNLVYSANKVAETARKDQRWWGSLTPGQKKSYLKRHPGSKYGNGKRGGKEKQTKGAKRNAKAKEAISALPRKEQRELKRSLQKVFEPDKNGNTAVSKVVDKKIGDPKKFAKSMPKDRLKEVSNAVREAMKNRLDTEKAAAAGKAIGKMVLKAGIIGVAGVGAASLGFPVEVFIPSLMENVWRSLDEKVAKMSDVDLVTNLASAVKEKARETRPDEEEVERSLRVPDTEAKGKKR